MIDLLQAIQETRKSAREIFEGEQNKLLTLQHTRYLTECHDASRGNGWDVFLVLQQTHLCALGAPFDGTYLCRATLPKGTTPILSSSSGGYPY
jgi:hypothetical protein